MFDRAAFWNVEVHRAGPGGPLVPVFRAAAAAVRCKAEDHDLVVGYHRPWRRLFRRRSVIRCSCCALRIGEP